MTDIPPEFRTFYGYVAWIWEYVTPERYHEIRGISDAVGNDSMSLSDAILLNSLYELESFCTSIVAQTSEGKIFIQEMRILIILLILET